MTVINPKSISGITSITTSSGADDLLTIHNYSGAERFRIDGDGNTRITSGIVTTLSVEAITGHIKIDDRILHTGDTNTMIRFPANDTFSVETAGVQRVTVDASGRLLVGGTSEYTAYSDSKIQVATNDSTASASFTRWSNDGSSPYLNLGKSRGSVGSYTVVQNGDRLGQINFVGADGTDMASHAASIAAYVDGAPGSNDMPGRIVFATSSDGGVAETERVRINSVGKVGINSTAPDGMLAIEHTSSAPNLTMRNHPAAGPYTNEYGLELRHAYGSVKHGALIHTQEAADGRRSLDVSDSNGVFATFVNGKVGIGSEIPTQKLDVNGLIKITGSGGQGLDIENSGGTNAACINLKNTLSSYVKEYRIAVAGSDGAYATASSLFVRDQTANANRLEIQSGGDVRIGTGDIYFGAAGKGIVLGATSNTDANTLDDYEEGSWTPDPYYHTSVNTQIGRYTKIGNMVYAYFNVCWYSSSASHQYISNLPFVTSNSSGGTGGVARGYQNYDIENGPIYHVGSNTNDMYFYKNNGQAFAASNGSGNNFAGYVVYQVP